MTDLSLAAMAVLDAFSNASDGEYIEGEWIVDERTMLAAALRAAAEQTRRKRIISNYGPIAGEDYCLISDLDAIATELENA